MSLGLLGSFAGWRILDTIEAAKDKIKKQKSDTVPFWRIPASLVLAILYRSARVYLIESLVALRAEPASPYGTANWCAFFPHV